jgi:hypothetical protein
MKIRNKETGEIREINPQELKDYGLDIPEAKNGIHIKESHKGLLHKQLGVAEGKKIPASKLKIKPSDSETTRKRKQFAINASRWKHQDGGQAMQQQQQQQPQGGGQEDQMQQLVQMAEQALSQGASPEKVAQMLVQQGVPEQVVQQVIQYAIQDLQQQQQAQGQNPQGQNPQEEAQEQGQQQNPQEEQAEMRYGGMTYANGGGIDNPGFRALPAYVQQDIINNMQTGGRFLRKAQFGVYDNNSSYKNNPNDPNSAAYNNFRATNAAPNTNNPIVNMGSPFGNFQNPLEQYSFNDVYNPNRSIYPQTQSSQNSNTFISPKNPRPQQDFMETIPLGGYDQFGNIKSPQGLQGYNPETGGNLVLKNSMTTIGDIPSTIYNEKQYDTNNNKSNWFNDYAGSLANISGGNSYFGRGIQHLGQATFDFTKGGLEQAGANISNRNALGDEANNLRSAMRNDYKRTGKRPTDGNAIISKYGGKMMQDGGATYADKMKVSKNSPQADFIAEKGEYIVNNGIASKLETGGSHASGNDTAISLDKSSNPSYVLSDTPRLKQLQFGGKRVSPSKYAEMATVEALGKTPDQILKAYTAFTKRAGTEGKIFGDRISDATNQLLAQKYQKDLATVKQIADQAYHKQEQLKYAMGMDNDLDHAQEVNGMSMAKSGGMQDDVHMNYFNAPAVQYGGSPQLFSDSSELGYNTTQMAYGGLPKMQNAGNANSTIPAYNIEPGRKNSFSPNVIPPISFDQLENEEKKYKEALSKYGKNSPETKKAMENFTNASNAFSAFREFESFNDPQAKSDGAGIAYMKYKDAYEKYASTAPKKTITTVGNLPRYNDNTPQNYSGPNQQQISFIPKGALSDFNISAQEYQAKMDKAEQDARGNFNAPVITTTGQNVVNPTPGVVASSSKVTTPTKNIGNLGYKVPVSSGTSSYTAPSSNSNVSANVSASNSTNTTPSYSTSATAANPYSGWKGQTFSTPEGITTPTGINLNKDPMANWASFAQKYAGKDSRITAKQTPEAIGALQEVVYDEYLDTPQGQEALNKMWSDYGVTNNLEKNYSGIATKIKNKEKLTVDDLKLLRANYIDKLAGKRLPEMLPDAPAPGKPPVTPPATPAEDKGQEVDKKKLDIETASKKATNYDIPAINAYIPQSYGRNPIGLQLAQAQTIRPAKLNIQPELNEYNRGMRGALRGTQGNTSVNVAQQMQGLNNLYDAQNKLFGQKYNFDEQSRAGADQFNAQAIMNTDAANLQRIGVNQDNIARREGMLDTQRRTDFQAGLENADKENAYGLSKQYIESTFGPYLNNEGKLNFTYDPTTGEKINKDKEKTYTRAEWDKKIADEKKAAEGKKYGGSLKKIKLKLRK